MANDNKKEAGVVSIGHLPRGTHNAVTDVGGVRVGHKTIIRGEGEPGTVSGVARTGVSVVYPHKNVWSEPVYAGTSILNGNGEMTGCAWVDESGLLTTPIALTNTHSLGVVRDALIEYCRGGDSGNSGDRGTACPNRWILPVVAETWDGYLSDIDGMHVRKEDVFEALEDAQEGHCLQGNVGGGTGTTCFEFKGGIGSSSRKIYIDGDEYTVGVLVQANYGMRYQFMIEGVPVGREINLDEVPGRADFGRPSKSDTGSVVVVIATDVPLLPDQCKRLARRASLGLGLTGSIGANSSGDFFIAFSTGNRCRGFFSEEGSSFHSVATVGPETMNGLFEGAVEAVQESVINALLYAETMTGIDGRIAHALPAERLKEILRERNTAIKE
ncbi:MAG: P1 family peptidase [Spirochaetia bacterium]